MQRTCKVEENIKSQKKYYMGLKRPPKIPLGSFCVGHLLVGMDAPGLKCVFLYTVRPPWGKLIFHLSAVIYWR